MKKSWLTAISSDDWNLLVCGKEYVNVSKKLKAPSIAPEDIVCFYVRETSSIKGVAKISANGGLIFWKQGDLNFFGIADSLEFVKDKDVPVKYLKNFAGVANLGKPLPSNDVDLILERIIPEGKPGVIIEEEIPLDKKFTTDSDYQKIFKLENALREFVMTRLESVSKNWVKERVPDQQIVKKWNEREYEYKKQDKWFNQQESNLLQFSEFSDLLTLIISRKNWRECFEETLGHKVIFEGKMTELGKIRNDIAHTRTLSQEEKDALDLYCRQILRLITINKPNKSYSNQ